MAFKFKLGFGKAEVTKAAKGAGIAGGGAVLATALMEVGILPNALMAPPIGLTWSRRWPWASIWFGS